MAERINSYRDLRVYQNAMDAAMRIFALTKHFPPEERYSLVDQIRRSSRSVCANIAKLSDAESEACETQVWIEFSFKCHYVNDTTKDELDKGYDQILSQLVRMIDEADKWLIK